MIRRNRMSVNVTSDVSPDDNGNWIHVEDLRSALRELMSRHAVKRDPDNGFQQVVEFSHVEEWVKSLGVLND